MRSRPKGPPKALENILEKLVLPRSGYSTLGDIEERYSEIFVEKGTTRAVLWYAVQIIHAFLLHLSYSFYRSRIMVKNYLKIALRNLLKQKAYSFINILGLAIGITCCVLILLYVQHELSYDTFHERSDEVYRVAFDRRFPTIQVVYARTPIPLGQVMVDELPEVVESTRLWDEVESQIVTFGEKSFREEKIIFGDQNFFDFFTVPLISGDPKTALANPNSVVITRETAMKYFATVDALGKTLTFSDYGDLQVTGVSENIPANSHFHFDFLPSFISDNESFSPSWAAYRVHTYITFQEGVDPDIITVKMPDVVEKYVGPAVQQALGVTYDEYLAAGNRYDFFPQKITDIHLHSNLTWELEPNGDITYVYMFSVISIFILLIACVNFMNLATARSASRAKEVGVMKVLGSFRMQLIHKFLMESTIISLIALILSIGLIQLSLPFFNDLAGKELAVNFFANMWVIPLLLGFAVLIGVLSGSYPAFFLSAFRPVMVLKGSAHSVTKSSFLRNGLVVFQFAVSVILILGTAVVYDQMEFMVNKKLGFDKEHVLILEGANMLGGQRESFKQELLSRSDIVSVSSSTTIPGGIVRYLTFTAEGSGANERVLIAPINADEEYLETWGMELARGRSFSRDITTDVTTLVINEAAARDLKYDDPIGKRLTTISQVTYTIIGIVKDFHYQSLHQEIAPLAIRINSNPVNNTSFMSIRFSPENTQTTIQAIENAWGRFAPNQPFTYSFLDEEFASLYEAEKTTEKVFAIFAVLAVVIACLGLLGLSAFMAEQRMKEVGIRKVLGATSSSVVVLFSREFTKLVVVAFLFASPIAYYAMNKWLQGFAYRIDISIWVFVLTGIATLAIALLTVSYQSIKSAMIDPVTSLKHE